MLQGLRPNPQRQRLSGQRPADTNARRPDLQAGCVPLVSLASARATRMLAWNGNPRRNEGKPDLSASGTLSPNPCQGPLPLDPAVAFSWSTGVAPRYPPQAEFRPRNDAGYR